MLTIYKEPFIQEIQEELFKDKGLRVFIKREDQIHPTVSGNKWRKLKYNLQEAKNQGHDTLLTFGGAYSNHIYATAAAAKEGGFKSIGIIRGDELADKPLNKTLSFAREQGMQLVFVDRQTYGQKEDESFLESLELKHGEFYMLPEGGTNNLAIKGCEEILNDEDKQYDVVCCSVGTGGTISGIIASTNSTQQILGFSALKGDFLKNEVQKLLENYSSEEFTNWSINIDYHFGGYAKTNSELLTFINDFERRHQIPLDQVYTGKMMYGIYDLVRKDLFKPGLNILAIHTGGLQGKLNS
ncbi:1-aminocyclopropane-1-carboxylate deaminase/D-cysteine desulfhydrase [Fulvivirga lutimaris]|uniref:1-aminocyclopropane-1-carboxylate deaminase/D-cysteine desulfhydrase n=1 Tax=Fulvivirga lutimaris TaxID=1819566 RepID=UPI0012BCE5D6|nr:pyridoxal-phosphate dependent enzyme [Fulvivirga lutimaris]MTI41062.1 1-aminocyclopropane-1-carboxylate deaminase/D-cysteine desulfhydrase [Fulvivirga lutimaris]